MFGAIGNHADAMDGKALTQAMNHRQQGVDIGGVARPGLGADRSAMASKVAGSPVTIAATLCFG